MRQDKHRPPLRSCRIPLALLLLAVLMATACGNASPTVPTLSPRVLGTLPHDPAAFTQGFLVHHGVLYESTGRFGESSVRTVDLETGRVLAIRPLPDDRFGEGLAARGMTLLQLTWKSETGYVYDLNTLTELGTFHYQGEGWGLAATPEGPVMSNGSSRLVFLDPKTLTPARAIHVADQSGPVDRLNELEWVDGRLWCNIWLADRIAVVNPKSGTVIAYVDLSSLREQLPETAGAANGIAYDPESRHLLVTGKNWPRIFRIAVHGMDDQK